MTGSRAAISTAIGTPPNAVVAALFRSLGFAPWELEGLALKPGEVY
jgi:hypothetical protein